MKWIRDISPAVPKKGSPAETAPIKTAPPSHHCARGRFFQNIWVAFLDLGEVDTACGACDSGEGTCRLVMCLSGDLRFSVSGSARDEDFILCAGSCSLQYQPGACRYQACAPHSRAQLLELVFPPRDFADLVGGTPLGRELEAAMHAGRPLHIQQPMTAGIHQAVAGLRDAVVGAAPGVAAMVLAKALEMVWLLASSQKPAPKQVNESTRRAVAKAQSILESNMTDPPALGDLAAEIGMSVSKLKLVFLYVCGMPPYAYLRQVRMERAGRLLRDQGLSVTEAAFEVGYSNLSHFAKAFAGHHGINPSQAQRGK